jgi:selenocysteine lyase/cysteine desulfurase
VRVSLGAGNSAAEVDGFLAALQATVLRLQQLTAMAV